MRAFIITFFLSIPMLILAQDKPQVIATATMIADMAKNIVGDKMDVTSIVPIGGDPHLHEPTPGDAQLVVKADVILMNGLTFEGWLNELVANSGTKASVDTVTAGIKPISSLVYENAVDPHAWMDVELALIYIKNIYESILKIDTDNKDYYQANYEAYAKKLKELDEYIKTEVQKIPEEQRVLITSHDAFQYYGEKYGIRLESILGTSTDAEAQTSDVMRVQKTIKKFNVPALFVESTINPKLLEQIASDNGAIIGGKLHADSIGDLDGPAGSYYDMMKSNTDNIVAGLSRIKAADEHTEAPKSTSYYLGALTAILFIGAVFFYFTKYRN